MEKLPTNVLQYMPPRFSNRAIQCNHRMGDVLYHPPVMQDMLPQMQHDMRSPHQTFYEFSAFPPSYPTHSNYAPALSNYPSLPSRMSSIESGMPQMPFNELYEPNFRDSCIVMPTQHSTVKMLPVLILGNLEIFTCRVGNATLTPGPILFFVLGKQIKHTIKHVKSRQEFRSYQDSDNCLVPTGAETAAFIVLDGLMLQGNVETLRYLSKKLGEYGADRDIDYVVDYAASILQEWWVHLQKAFSSLSFDSDASIRLLNKDILHDYFTRRKSRFIKLETFLKHVHEKVTSGENNLYFAGNKPTFVDYILFAILFEDKALAFLSGYKADFITETSELKTLYDSLERHPHIRMYTVEIWNTINHFKEHNGDSLKRQISNEDEESSVQTSSNVVECNEPPHISRQMCTPTPHNSLASALHTGVGVVKECANKIVRGGNLTSDIVYQRPTHMEATQNIENEIGTAMERCEAVNNIQETIIEN